MADESYKSTLGLRGGRRVMIQGSFAPDTANPPTTLRGNGFTVVRVSAGLFRITTTGRFLVMESFTGSLQLAAAAARFWQVGACDPVAGTFEIRVIDAAGAVQDVAANANNRVNFVLILKNTLGH